MTDEVRAEWEKVPDTCPSEGTFTETIDRTDMVNEIWDEAPDAFEDEGEYGRPYTKKEFPTPTDIAKNKGYTIVSDDTKRDGVRFEQVINHRWERMPSRAKFPTIDIFARDYCGYCEVNGRYGYMDNPNDKYDWYCEGYCFLSLKDGNTANVEMLTEVDWEKTGTPYCFVDTEGEWHERGSWFDRFANKEKQVDWYSEFKSYVEKLLKDEQASEIKVWTISFHS